MVLPLTPEHAARPTVALLVDHDADTRGMYAEFLRQSKLEIDEAEEGREALAKVLSSRPDIVVSETRLPGLSGLELCALIRRDATISSTPFIFVTADAFPADIKRAEAIGANCVLIKPCLPERLLVEVRRLTSQGHDLRDRSAVARAAVADQLARSDRLIEKSRENFRRVTLSKALNRVQTTAPPVAPPGLVCPVCDHPLDYVRSHVGGVSIRHLEQWDYFECPAGCGTFQYRQRTRKLRKV
jgi:two-component system cell cycle response regulator DivK